MLDPFELFRATVLVLSDQPEIPVDALFIHGRVKYDEGELFDLAFNLKKDGHYGNLVINGGDGGSVSDPTPRSAWPGATKYRRLAKDLGLENHLFATRPALHTREENDALLELAKEQRWKRLLLLTQPHHVLRCLLGMVRVMSETGTILAVYSSAPTSLDWDRAIKGSQGLGPELPRYALIEEELERIEKYQAKGDLATFTELFEYLRKRD